MRQDSVSISRFYDSPLGRAAGRVLAQRIIDLWADTAGLSLLGVGYPQPVLAPFAAGARRLAVALPDGAGHARWDASGRGNSTVIGPEARLPFQDGVFDRVIVLHGLEEAANPRAVCREIWRVMAPEGRIIVGLANRSGLWARAERTPFGHGRPWTKRQISGLLSDCTFQVTASTHALFMPPIASGLIASGADGWERAGAILAPALGGVVLVEAVKRIYIDPGRGAVAPALSAIKARTGRAGVPTDRAGHRVDKDGAG